MKSDYAGQHRGEGTAYDRYLAGMDASMRQKVALTAAHLLSEGKVADMGMGSGTGSHALAALYPDLQVVGVDVDPEMVERATQRYPLANLSFVVGDIAEACFGPESLEAIFDSSVLHHVTSFSGYDRDAARRALAVQSEALRLGGVLVVRDFLDPGPGQVWLDLPTDDGEGDHPEQCSTAALFERFSREFRYLFSAGERGFSLDRLEDTPDGWARYQCSHTLAAEFLLRKDYRADWRTEVQEEYTWATQAEVEGWFAAMGLRVLASTPIRNPWIVDNRLEGRYRMVPAGGGDLLDHPATNYVIVGQKADPAKGVALAEEAPAPRLGYLELTHWHRTSDGRTYDLVRRPNTTLDVLPWYRAHGRVYVLARRSYPRPIVGIDSGDTAPVDGTTPSTWLSEPLNVQQLDKPVGQTVSELLSGFPGIGLEGILGFSSGSTYYPSPGGIQEEVRSVRVEIAPVHVDHPLAVDNGFSTAGDLRAMEARQLLRAAQVGGLPDARLEHNVYDLLLDLGLGVGPWIGQEITLADGADKEPELLADILAAPSRRLFRPAQSGAGFLDVRCRRFVESNAAGDQVGERVLEYVVPTTLSFNTVATAVLRRHRGEVLVALDDDDLPAAQTLSGNSNVLVTPAWRLPHDVGGIRASRSWIAAQLAEQYGLEVRRTFELGGRYHPSAGVTPEVVWPLAFDVEAVGDGRRRPRWVRLSEAVALRDQLVDGHLRTAVLRAAHALGVIAP